MACRLEFISVVWHLECNDNPYMVAPMSSRMRAHVEFGWHPERNDTPTRWHPDMIYDCIATMANDMSSKMRWRADAKLASRGTPNSGGTPNSMARHPEFGWHPEFGVPLLHGGTPKFAWHPECNAPHTAAAFVKHSVAAQSYNVR